MFGPYRTPPERDEPPPARAEQPIVLALLLLVLGGVRLSVAAVTHELWGLEPALAALLCAGGIRLLTRQPR